MTRQLAAILCSLCLIGSGTAQALHTADEPTESPRTSGPHGLEAWTLNWPSPDKSNNGERYPFTLLIARHGHVVRKIDGDPFVWRWIFWADGKQVAYESGPLHFAMLCKLVDLATGRQLEERDCFSALPEGSPDWAKALENSR